MPLGFCPGLNEKESGEGGCGMGYSRCYVLWDSEGRETREWVGVCKYVYGMQCVMGMSQVVNTCAVC